MGEKLTKKGVSKAAPKKRNPSGPVRRSAPTTKEPTPETIAIGERIAAILAARGLQRSVVAERAGIAYSTVGQRIQGLATHKWVDLANFARALGVTPNDILGFSTATDVRLHHKLLAKTLSLLAAHGPLNEDHAVALAECISEALDAGAALPQGIEKEDALLAQCEGLVRLFLLRHGAGRSPKTVS